MVVLFPSLFIIFNKSVSSRIFPEFWKSSYFKPFIKTNKAHVYNYRPICNHSNMPKLFETIVAEYFKSITGLTLIDEQFDFLTRDQQH